MGFLLPRFRETHPHPSDRLSVAAVYSQANDFKWLGEGVSSAWGSEGATGSVLCTTACRASRGIGTFWNVGQRERQVLEINISYFQQQSGAAQAEQDLSLAIDQALPAGSGSDN